MSDAKIDAMSDEDSNAMRDADCDAKRDAKWDSKDDANRDSKTVAKKKRNHGPAAKKRKNGPAAGTAYNNNKSLNDWYIACRRYVERESQGKAPSCGKSLLYVVSQSYRSIT
jgi:hypothetical protein